MRFQLQSGLDLLALEREFVGPLPALGEFTFRDTPQLQLDGRTRFGSPSPAEAQAQSQACGPIASANRRTLPPRRCNSPAISRSGGSPTASFNFDRAETDFSWSGDRWYLRGMRLVRPGGNGQQITGDVLSDPTQVNVRLTSTVDPVPFFGLLPKKVQETAGRLEFRDPPRLELTAAGRSLADPAGLSAKGQITLGRARYRGVGINKLRGDWSFAGHTITARNLRLERDEGVGTADALVLRSRTQRPAPR